MIERFPKDFVWGTATSSYQIEGSTDEGGRGPSIWDVFAARPGAVKDGSDGSRACESWHRYPEDIALMKQLGVDAYRFSIAWPRLFPTGHEKTALAAGLDGYDRQVDALLEAGIDPWITLYHWDLPQGLEDLGGWPDRRLVEPFVRFAEATARRLGDRVSNWITLNEPWCSAMLGYSDGWHAPGRKQPPDALAAVHNLLLAHGEAVPVMRSVLPAHARIGITLNMNPAYPASQSPADREAARVLDGEFNRWYLDPIHGRGYPGDIWHGHVQAGRIAPEGPWWMQPTDLSRIAVPLDFLGINYYSRAIMRGHEHDNWPREIPHPPDELHTDIGWEIFPDGLRDLLLRLQRDYPGLPFVITENGGAWHTGPDENGRVPDHARVDYLRTHINAVAEAIEGGADVAGYFVWSLLDNFEWAEGYTQRFGIVHVDFDTMKRTPKDSFYWVRDLLASRR